MLNESTHSLQTKALHSVRDIAELNGAYTKPLLVQTKCE